MLGTSYKPFKWDWAVSPLASRTRNTWSEAFALPRCWGGKSWLGTGTTHQRIKGALGLWRRRRRRAQHTTTWGHRENLEAKRPLGGRLAQTRVQRAEGCFIYFSICWLLVVALAHVRQTQRGGGVAQAHREQGGGGSASLARGGLRVPLCCLLTGSSFCRAVDHKFCCLLPRPPERWQVRCPGL